MAKKLLFTLLRILMILILSLWVFLWFLKPTNFWNKSWKKVEDSMQITLFKYNGTDFMVHAFPIILLAMVGIVYMYLQPRRLIRRGVRSWLTILYNPVIVKTPLGMLSGIDVAAMSLFLTLLVWTFYARISNDYKKLVPEKHLKLNIWEHKFLKMSTRFGLMAEICLGFLLFPILRGLSLFRLIGVQFEASVRYHIWLGSMLAFFATLHGVGTLFIWGVKHRIQTEIWSWQKEGRIYMAGVIAMVTLLVIWTSSLPLVRRRKFEVFFYMHHLYAVFFVFFLFHAGDRHFYMVFAGVFLFALDKLLRVIQSNPTASIHSVKILPGSIVELTFPKDPKLSYTPTSIIFIKIPMISKCHWHPFSITSSCIVDNQTMSIMIRCAGSWTNSLYTMMCKEVELSKSQPKRIPVAVEGPYGPPSFDFIRYDQLLFIAGGIGITPILSILQELTSTEGDLRNRFSHHLHLIYVTKKSQGISLLNPISHLLLNQTSKYCHLNVSVFVTQEKQGGSSLSEQLSSFSKPRTILFDKKNSRYAIGTAHLNPIWIGAMTVLSSLIFLLSLIFFNQFLFASKQTSLKPKRSSSVVDFFLLCSFFIAVACSALVAMTLRWKNSRTECELESKTSNKEDEVVKLSLVEGASTATLEEYEIQYGTRPNFKDLLSKMESEFKESNVGVVVCGPELMKESIASACQQKLHPAIKSDSKQNQQPSFVFHSLNFSL